MSERSGALLVVPALDALADEAQVRLRGIHDGRPGLMIPDTSALHQCLLPACC